MNWQKYSIDEWLEQFGIWCNQCTIKGGNLPDGLHTNQIYYLMRQVEPMPTKPGVICEISDDEAGEINKLLCEGMKIIPMHTQLVIEHVVNGRSLRDMADNYSYNHIRSHIHVGKAYLAGLRQIEL